MKKVIWLIWFMPALAFGQILENFETGLISNWVQSINGHWSIDTISSLSGRYSLHHTFDNADAGTDEIGLPLFNLKPSLGTVKWSFMIRHGCDPSATNNWAAFLLSDNEPAEMHPGGQVNGFALGVNLTGSDDTLRLWKMKNGTPSVVISTPVNWQNNIGMAQAAKIDVERSQSGIWKIKTTLPGGQEVASPSGADQELFEINWFGLLYRYTSTRDRLLWLDDLEIDGVFIEDTDPPEIVRCIQSGKNSVVLAFDEEPDNGFLSNSNFMVNGNNEAVQIVKLAGTAYQLTFRKMFINKSLNNLIIKNLCDKKLNCSQNTMTQFNAVWAEPGDVVITEIMADPLPPVSLPGKEYLEIYNTTGFSISLKNWHLSSDGQEALFPDTEIRPDEFLITCSITDTTLFSRYGRTIGMKSFPALTDNGKVLILSDSTGKMIHGIDYSANWYLDQIKLNGGWSLEMIDTKFPFYMNRNWRASESVTGGTPGETNSVSSVNPDLNFSGITNVFPVDSVSVEVTLSEPVKDPEIYLDAIRINETPVNSLVITEPLQRVFLMKSQFTFKRNTIYSLTLPDNITDFAGNQVEKNIFRFGIPEIAARNDVVFNELLFNPFPGDADYLEFYNNSDKIINVSDLFLVPVNDETGDSSELFRVSDIERCFLPGSYYTVTSNPESIVNRYFSCASENIFYLSQLPSMPDDKGHLILLNRNRDLIDEVLYSEKMHFSLLSGYEGIALEKIRPAIASDCSENWHSASEVSGWGTPGAPNSVYIEKPATDDKFTFSSTRISPDNDGYEDILVIDFNLDGTGNVVSVLIFDENGQLVRKLAENILAGAQASITWDGTANDGSLLRQGIYILYISVFDDNGKTKKWKKVCSVIR